MSTKLDAEALAAKMFPARGEEIEYGPSWREAAKRTIREVAQPLADERDEYRGVVENFVKWMNMERKVAPIKEAEAILSKYPKP